MTLAEIEDLHRTMMQAWEDADVAGIVALYADDCIFYDSEKPDGVKGSKALAAYLEELFARIPAIAYETDKVWQIEGGYCARTFAYPEGGTRLRTYDVHMLRDGKVVQTEAFQHFTP